MTRPIHSIAARIRCAGLSLAAVAVAMALATPASADDRRAMDILKSMSDYLASQATLSASFDSGIEVVTSDMEKVQFNASGTVALERPGKLRARRTGGYVDVDMVFDGKSLTVHLPDLKSYAKVDIEGDIDALLDNLLDRGIVFPGGDLLGADAHAILSEDVIEAKHIGTAVVGGHECEHLAFREKEIDWQLWVRTGTEPVPCKYVITSKHVAGAPQYTLVVRDWSAAADGGFEFKPADGETEVKLEDLPSFDELPEEAE